MAEDAVWIPLLAFASYFSVIKASSCMKRSWESKLTEVSQELGNDIRHSISCWGKMYMSLSYDKPCMVNYVIVSAATSFPEPLPWKRGWVCWTLANNFRVFQALIKLVNFLNKGNCVNKQIKPFTHDNSLLQPTASFRFRFSYNNLSCSHLHATGVIKMN